jgi:hypothetical protein
LGTGLGVSVGVGGGVAVAVGTSVFVEIAVGGLIKGALQAVSTNILMIKNNIPLFMQTSS